ncbi:MAG: hypothetical protein KJZ80_11350 [Hyphomicrobiaceae bacterium]|nr:hypothetical protein [Hyphomicrobiaceae bacterium]
MRVWVGFAVLLAGIWLASLHFQPRPETASVEELVKAHQRGGLLTTSSVVLDRTGELARTKSSAKSRSSDRAGEEPAVRSAAAPWERRAIVVGAGHVPAAASRTVIVPDQPEDTLTGYELARALQTELRRVGCYHGDIDGAWGPMSKRAMSGFTDRVNASLPVEAPDQILLTMVRGYEGEACGSCRANETRSDAGRCMPTAALAHRRPADGVRAGETRTTRVHTIVAPQQSADAGRAPEPLPGRMAVGAPVDTVQSGVALTREGAEDASAGSDAPSSRRERRERLAERASPPSFFRQAPSRSRKHWTQTIFDELSRR